MFLREKSKTIEHLKFLCTKIQVEIAHLIARIRSDTRIEFDNVEVDLFCDSKGIKHKYLASRTPQQNGVAKKNNRVFQEMARVMLHMHNTFVHFGLKPLIRLVVLPIWFS